MTSRSFFAALGFALVMQAAACGDGSGGTGGGAGSAAGGGGGGGAGGGSGGCAEIAYTQMIYSPGGLGGSSGTGGGGGGTVSVISDCRSFPAVCANDHRCDCVCHPGFPCYNGLTCACTESNGALSLTCYSD